MLHEGIQAAEDIIAEVFRVDVSKALDPLDPNDFLRIIFRLQKGIQGITGPAEAAAMLAALNALDIDWATASEAKKEAVMKAANQAIKNTANPILPALKQTFTAAHTTIVGGTVQKTIETFGLDIGSSLTLEDKRVAKQAAKAQAHYVRDEYGRRADAASNLARKVVAEGLKNGLGRVEIGGELEKALQAQNLKRSRAYYNMVASVYAGRSRQYASLRSYDEAGITVYKFVSVMDEVTSLQCRFMNGREFKVKADLQKYKDVANASDPEQVKYIQPWIATGKDANGDEVLYLKNEDGSREQIALVTENAMGQLDEAGSFKANLTDAQLQAKGCTCPPLHGNCRSTIVPSDTPASSLWSKPSPAKPAARKPIAAPPPAAVVPPPAPAPKPLPGVPRKGLKFSDLPSIAPPSGYDNVIPSATLPTGESREDYQKRTAKALEDLDVEQKFIIRDFTGHTYGEVRESEESGNPNHQAKVILEAFKSVKPDPGVAYRGIEHIPMPVIEKWLEHTGPFRLGRDNKGATSSTSWHPGVAVQKFMWGDEDPSHPEKCKVLFTIKHKSGIPVETISNVRDEAEVLLSSKAEFKITKVSKWKGRKRVLVIELEEI